MKELWTSKYSPKTLDEYVFRDAAQKEQVKSWVESGAIPHLLFSGAAGTGKTTLAKVLLNELGVDPGDILTINASITNGVEEVRNKILNFATTMPFGEFKYILLDEADYLSPNAQAALRGVMVDYSNFCRFLLTCNYPHKIIPAIHSRCQGFHIEKLDKTEFTARIAEILIGEGIDVDIEVLDIYVAAEYPDMRKCIGLCQQNAQTGKLLAPHVEELGESDYRLQMVALFRENRIKDARAIICKSAPLEEYEDIYRHLYENLHYWGETEEKQMKAILIIRNALVNHTSVADAEINLSACLCELEFLAQE